MVSKFSFSIEKEGALKEVQSQDDEELNLDAKSSMKKSISNFSAEDKMDGEDLKAE